MPVPATPHTLIEAAQILRGGGLVAFPTETVYGLGADATNWRAVARLFEAKGRPRFNPLIVHVADADAARRLARFDARAETLAARFWPGPLTLVLPMREGAGLSDLVTAGLPTVAVRVPGHAIAQELLRLAAIPVCAPSANTSGKVSPTRAAHVAGDLGGAIDMILDGGPCAAGLESTIIGLADGTPRLLRSGAVPRSEIESVLGTPLADPQVVPHSPNAPGQLASHYAPRAKLRLNATAVEAGERLLGFGPDAPADALNLSPAGDLREAAANLFAALRELDATGTETIAVMPVPHTGLGEAINDRLARAAAPRPAINAGET
jgi:L-threonylcarbamoyladenylate synthase